MVLKNFWKLLYSNVADTSFQNKTIDVVLKDCYVNKNITVCVGNLTLTALCLITFYICLHRIGRFYNSYQSGFLHYVIFCAATAELFCLTLKFGVFVLLYQLEILASILKLVQFVALCHLSWSLVLNQSLIQYFIRPLLGVFTIICTIIAVLAISLNFSSWIDCLIPHWIILSTAEFICILGLPVTAYKITQQINSMNNNLLYKQKQKNHLYSVIIAYELSSIVTLAYYSTLQGLGNEHTGCSGIFGHVQEIFSSIYTLIIITRYLVPIWVMIIIFQPTRGYLSIETSFGRYSDSAEPFLNPVEELPATNSVEGTDEVTINPRERTKSTPALHCPSFFAFCNPQRLCSSVPSYGTLDTNTVKVNNYSPTLHQPSSWFKQERSVNKVSTKVNQYSEEEENVTCSGEEI